jgi:hypothetical protein
MMALCSALPSPGNAADPQFLKKMYVLRRILNPMGTMEPRDWINGPLGAFLEHSRAS